MKTEMEKVSYIIGQQIGADFKAQDLGIDVEILANSIKDAHAGEEPKISPQEMQEIMQSFQQKMQKKMAEEQKEASGTNTTEGKAFLAENAKKDGVVVTSSGLQYKVITEGTGKTPKATDTVETHYEGKLINGEIFDSSLARGQTVTFPVNGVIKGWTEALQLMKVGAKWELYIPAELAYGENGAGPKIGPNATLIFQVELVSIK
ncbi:MAG: FKBP-type peptidyl-prolyl cis-trans isomerase [Candidatus Omnitrophica bacterium]|nr:FKBP-type peptidyl-prolyl cis-trans isomerase [Candidatus Margulisiibacteriota bacterium]MBU1869097.1 FKBP-type peptidyl-prolyl cis-trans isomerase [Candidatus Omnitrophota bacterium]